MNIRKYKNKLLGEYYSVSIDDLKKDNLLTALYVCKYHARAKLGSDHLKKTLMKWKSELKHPKTLNEDLGNTLKMNIKLNTKPVYSKYKKTYKDVELTMNKEGLYKPVLRNMVTGGGNGEQGLASSNQAFSNLFSSFNNGERRQNVRRQNVRRPVRTQRSQPQIYEPIVHLSLHKHRLVINEKDKKDLLKDESEVQKITIPDVVNSQNLMNLINAGYYVFSDPREQIYPSSNHSLVKALNDVYKLNTNVPPIEMPALVKRKPAEHISMSKFYFGTDTINDEQQINITKIAYVLHYDKDRTNIVKPISIQSNINIQYGGNTKNLKKTNTKIERKKTSGGVQVHPTEDNTPTGSNIKLENDDIDYRRSIFFYVINHETIGLKRFVIKISFEDDHYYKYERKNYEELKERNVFIESKQTQINNFMNGGSQQEFYKTHITKHYNTHGYTDGTIKIPLSEFDQNGDDITISIKNTEADYAKRNKNKGKILEHIVDVNNFRINNFQQKLKKINQEKDTDLSFYINKLKEEIEEMTNVNEKIEQLQNNKVLPKEFSGLYYFITEYDVKFATVDTTFDTLSYGKEYLQRQNILDKDLEREYQQHIEEIYKHVIETHRKAMELYGFYHGDLKPDNVLIDVDEMETVKIFDLDFSGFVCNHEQLKTGYEDRQSDPGVVKYYFQRFEQLYPHMRYRPTWEKFFEKLKYAFLCASDKCPKPEYIPMKYFLHGNDIWRMFYMTMYAWGISWELEKKSSDSSLFSKLLDYENNRSYNYSHSQDGNSVKRIVKCFMNLKSYEKEQAKCNNSKISSAEL